jgi:hypothetical protein
LFEGNGDGGFAGRGEAGEPYREALLAAEGGADGGSKGGRVEGDVAADDPVSTYKSTFKMLEQSR